MNDGLTCDEGRCKDSDAEQVEEDVEAGVGVALGKTIVWHLGAPMQILNFSRSLRIIRLRLRRRHLLRRTPNRFII